MKNNKQINDLIEAAINCANMAENKIKHEKTKVAILQEAAKLAREGNDFRAKQKLHLADEMNFQVFDFEDVFKDLIKAVKPFRGKK